MGKKLDLTKVKGVGERMAQKIVQQLGGEQELINAVENFEIDRISSIEGVSQRKAIEIINDLSGNSTEEFLKTERALQLYEEILEKILSYAHSSHAKNKILLLSPLQDPEKIKSSIDFVMEAKRSVSSLPIKHVRGLLNNLSLPHEIKPNYDPSVAILVESSEDYGYLVDLGLNRHFPIISAQESGEIQEYEFVIYVYSHGNLALDEQENVVMVSKDSEILEIIPESVLNYFTHNKSILTQVLELRNLLKKETVLDETIKILNELEELKYKEVDFDKSVNSAKKRADDEIKSAVKNVDLKGDEVLALLNQGMTGKIEKIFDEVISKARADIKLDTSTEFDPFLRTYPLEIDDAELERVKKQDLSKRQIEIFDKKVTAAKRLFQIRTKVDQEIKEALEFDYQFALGCFAHYYQLKTPEIGNAFHLEGALHLNLAHENESTNSSEDIQRIDYSLFYPENVALLTGANSGGKTTLLETLAQISIMTHMGLPVCAEKAEVKLLDEVYFFSKQRSLDAGAFESFLRTFMPIVTTDNQKLILLDELEAITELEAAVKIISSFIELINDSNSFAVIVTHMAREIIKYAPIRVDGIEAKGLDDNYNLLVDRTPKMNYLARSTPELILKMIYERSDGKLKYIYGKILEKF
ncbi:MAG: helix-hairpin-helix domain-containing protein [Methanobacteriaceae archaeon]|nr:helix-hairpin-helix domain-containing protein [Methanobacteriaceae archaeon]MDP2836302.1 helix-hairpin-helix domain-containing protein [Methanobacteriaceae archaeon]MDP3484006.1 helix-hairpin-helix domain-containing protein [Methanobacteriaceae archaeon]MDP3624292.1 helix-hairpin-helix domain-containing protein [Methanobacteriaceae archaeon]